MAQAQSVEAVKDRFLEAVGGEEALQNLNEAEATATLTMMGQNIDVLLFMKNEKQRMEMKLPSMTIIRATNGERAWEINPMAGVNTAQEVPVESVQSSEITDEVLLHYGEEGYEFEYVGEEDLEGNATYRLDITSDTGKEQHYFDQRSGLRVMIKTEITEGPQAGQMMSTHLSNYKEVNGLKTPFFMELKVSGQNFMTMKLNTVEISDIDDSIFEFPEQ
jgi:hypothetical protein